MEDSREELLLKKLNGEDVVLEPPQSRIEKLYYKLLGADIVTDPPQSRVEELLKEYIDNGGGGGGGGGGDVTWANITFINADTSTVYVVDGLVGIYNIGQFEIITELTDVVVQDESEVTVPLYKGNYAIPMIGFRDVDLSFFPQVTGNIVIDFDNECFVITGDGTITCKGMHID